VPNSQLIDEFGYLLDEAPPVNGTPGMPRMGRETTVGPYFPSWREQIAGKLMGDTMPGSPRGDVVGALMGSTGLGPSNAGTTLSAVDMVPGLGNVLNANDQARQGHDVRAVLSLLPAGPVAGALAKPALKYATPIASDLAELMRSMSRGM
jgi:hypothetical protein